MATSPNIFNNRRYGNWTVYIVAIVLTMIACTIAVVLRLFSAADLPFRTFAALIGVIITAIITGVLLKGQSDAEREQKEKAEIFKEKLSSYNQFLNALRNYVTDSTPQNKKALIFHTMALRMHCASDVMTCHYENVTKIISGKGGNNDAETTELVKTLNDIATAFRGELYGCRLPETESTAAIDNFARAIAGSREEPTETQREEESKEDEAEDMANKDAKVAPWADKVKELASKGWKLENKADAFELTSASSPIRLSVYRKKGNYVVEASKPDDNDFSQQLKDDFNGSRRYGTWWRDLPISNYGVTKGTLLTQLPTNDRARASVIKWIDKLIKYIETY